jgi:hypothetical protein
MAQGRGSARGGAAVVVGVLLLCVLLHAEVVESAVFNVGDRGGWSFNTNSWPTGKRFKAGDVLGTYFMEINTS